MTFIEAEVCLRYRIRVMLRKSTSTTESGLYGKVLNISKIGKEYIPIDKKFKEFASCYVEKQDKTEYIFLIENLKVCPGFEGFVEKKSRQIIYQK